MAYSHNCLLRGLNAISLQAPHVPVATSPGYSAQDVRDLLFYVASWVKTVEWHHHTEETVMFPSIEELAGQPGMLQDSKAQHEEFTPGLEDLLRYATDTKPEDHRWEGAGGMKEIIDGFTPSLTNHLYEEIDIFLNLRWLDSADLRKCWDAAVEVAKAKGKFYMLVGRPPLWHQRRRHEPGSDDWLSSTMYSRVCLGPRTRLMREATYSRRCPLSCRMSSSTGLEQRTVEHGGSTLAISGDSRCLCISYQQSRLSDKLHHAS